MENDKNILKGLADNQALMDALIRVINAQFAKNEVNLNMANDAIGQVVRANIMGRAIVLDALKEIMSYKTVPPGTSKPNPGR